jgi:hypothetical protein
MSSCKYVILKQTKSIFKGLSREFGRQEGIKVALINIVCHPGDHHAQQVE